MTVLVAVVSRHGSTTEIAETIARGRRARGCDVRLASAVDVRSLDGARSHELLGACLDRSNLPRRQRVLLRAMRAQVGDSRDWSRVKPWAGTVVDQLSAADSPAARSE